MSTESQNENLRNKAEQKRLKPLLLELERLWLRLLLADLKQKETDLLKQEIPGKKWQIP